MIRFTPLLAIPLLTMVAPAFAQSGSPSAATAVGGDITSSGAGQRVNQVTVYGNDPCPRGEDDVIVVCGRLDEGERYRIPEALRGNPNEPARQSWTSRVRSIERIGRFGTDSCSPTGLGGFTGCLGQLIDNAVAENAQARGTDWTTAVAAARAERMQGYDAAAQQVEQQIARDEAARVERQRQIDEATPPTNADGTPAPNPDSDPLPNPASARPPR
jgi:hypothetical protein